MYNWRCGSIIKSRITSSRITIIRITNDSRNIIRDLALLLPVELQWVELLLVEIMVLEIWLFYDTRRPRQRRRGPKDRLK